MAQSTKSIFERIITRAAGCAGDRGHRLTIIPEHQSEECSHALVHDPVTGQFFRLVVVPYGAPMTLVQEHAPQPGEPE